VIRRYDLWLSIIALFLILVFEASRAPFELFNIHHVLTNWNIGIFPIQVLKRFNLQVSHCNMNNHRLNMEWDIQSLFGLQCTAVLIGWVPATLPPLSPHLGSYTRALLISQDRRHLFVTPCEKYLISLTKRCYDWTVVWIDMQKIFDLEILAIFSKIPSVHLFERIIKSCCGARNNASCLFLNGFVKIRRRFLPKL